MKRHYHIMEECIHGHGKLLCGHSVPVSQRRVRNVECSATDCPEGNKDTHTLAREAILSLLEEAHYNPLGDFSIDVGVSSITSWMDELEQPKRKARIYLVELFGYPSHFCIVLEPSGKEAAAAARVKFREVMGDKYPEECKLMVKRAKPPYYFQGE